jgi:outer membrane lipoprotein-sorting protein
MKNYFKFVLPVFAAVFVFSGFAATESKAQGPLKEILKRMETHRQSLTSLRASLVMDKFNSQLGEHDVMSGTTVYLPSKGRDALVRIDWTKPVQESLAVANGQYVLYRQRLGQAIVGKVDNSKKETKANNALAFMSMSKEQLNSNYSVVYVGTENIGANIPTWHLKLTPKTASNYKYSELWVDGNGMPLQAMVVENNNDSTTIRLSSIEKNITLSAKLFHIDLPKGTKIVNS